MSTMKSKLSAKQQNANKRRRLNAFKHGTFSCVRAMLPGEDPKEFDQLLSLLHVEWDPQSPTEQDAVLDIAKGMWRKARNQRFIAWSRRLVIQNIRSSTNLEHCLNATGFSNHSDQKKFCKHDFESEAEWIEAMRTEILSVLLRQSISHAPPAGSLPGFGRPRTDSPNFICSLPSYHAGSFGS
jgi:hypothetical protein